MQRRRVLGPRGLALVACWLLASAAQAQAQRTQPAPLEMPIAVDPCVPVDVTAFRRQLAIELETAPQASDLARAQTSARIELGCSGEQIKVTVTDSAARRAWRRRIDLRGVPQRAHTRLLALSVAELLIASWLEQHIEADPRPAPSSPQEPGSTRDSTPGERSPDAATPLASSPAREPAPSPGPDASSLDAHAEPDSAADASSRPHDVHAQRLQLGAAGELLTFPSAPAPLFGGELHVSLPLAAAWLLRAAVQGGHGRIAGDLTSPAAPVRITAASLALALGWTYRVQALELCALAGARLGLLHLAGTESGASGLPQRAFAPWAGPLLSMGLRYPLETWLRVTLDLEVGLLAVRVRALAPEQRVVAELRGVWLLARLGLDLAL